MNNDGFKFYDGRVHASVTARATEVLRHMITPIVASVAELAPHLFDGSIGGSSTKFLFDKVNGSITFPNDDAAFVRRWVSEDFGIGRFRLARIFGNVWDHEAWEAINNEAQRTGRPYLDVFEEVCGAAEVVVELERREEVALNGVSVRMVGDKVDMQYEMPATEGNRKYRRKRK